MRIWIIVTFILMSSTWMTGQKTFEFTIEGMSCQGCINTATEVLDKVEGVESISIDLDSKRAIVVAGNSLTEVEIKRTLHNNTNFEVLFEGESLPKPLTEKERAGLDIKTIKGGDKINFKLHLAEGKLTIFDFYADWCGPCRVFSPKVERLLLENDKLALRKVDLVDWNSSIAGQLTGEYNLPALPFTLVFDEEGKLFGRVEGNDIEKVKQVISKL